MNPLKECGKEYNISQSKLKLSTTLKGIIIYQASPNTSKEDTLLINKVLLMFHHKVESAKPCIRLAMFQLDQLYTQEIMAKLIIQLDSKGVRTTLQAKHMSQVVVV